MCMFKCNRARCALLLGRSYEISRVSGDATSKSHSAVQIVMSHSRTLGHKQLSEIRFSMFRRSSGRSRGCFFARCRPKTFLLTLEGGFHLMICAATCKRDVNFSTG